MTRQPTRSGSCWKREHGSSIASGSVLEAVHVNERKPSGGRLRRDGPVRGKLAFRAGQRGGIAQRTTRVGVFCAGLLPSVVEQDEDFRDQLKRIVVEGHTNDDGTYELNLGLSHARSLAVMQVLLEEAEVI